MMNEKQKIVNVNEIAGGSKKKMRTERMKEIETQTVIENVIQNVFYKQIQMRIQIVIEIQYDFGFLSCYWWQGQCDKPQHTLHHYCEIGFCISAFYHSTEIFHFCGGYCFLIQSVEFFFYFHLQFYLLYRCYKQHQIQTIPQISCSNIIKILDSKSNNFRLTKILKIRTQFYHIIRISFQLIIRYVQKKLMYLIYYFFNFLSCSSELIFLSIRALRVL